MVYQQIKDIIREFGTRDPKVIAEEMGINILYLPYTQLYGMAACFGDHKLIGVKSELDEPIKKLVIAHELGHFVLHPEGNFYFVMDKTMFYNKFEYQANMFAISLCIGEEMAKYDFVKEIAAGKVDNIVNIFQYY
ncbi:ImmA/IrrE family metallo-endopeptidase [Biomaibacter acetigenes]|uniref:ImmA/IrrE family metallo-endopeptidase n=1 Tax=Biomaibacter acetigenes TaxID=2316383 RepID=A0A3G2R5F9_9FIRM|nr:ImmA/IrrE family metallo-endopeptidase [Biomaibacter acetigenes]AYO30642.1 ImmA/IrrE family metallo-endopeptidase [Biomaibacter acetigenes]